MRRVAITAVATALLAIACVPAAAVDWTYNRSAAATNGPAQWAQLSNGTTAYFPACGGTSQSPINFVNIPRADRSLSPLGNTWTDLTGWTMANNGHSLVVKPTAGGGSFEDPVTTLVYPLDEIHFHVASEHTFGGSTRDGEVHLVHRRADNATLVVALTVRSTESGYNAALAPLVEAMAGSTAAPAAHTTAVALSGLLPSDASYLTYTGSLTTPPCTEKVRWVVLVEPVELSTALVAAIRSALGTASMAWPGVSSFVPRGNARPTQALNNREAKKTQYLAAAGTIVGSIALSVALLTVAKLCTIPGPYGPKADGNSIE